MPTTRRPGRTAEEAPADVTREDLPLEGYDLAGRNGADELVATLVGLLVATLVGLLVAKLVGALVGALVGPLVRVKMVVVVVE